MTYTPDNIIENINNIGPWSLYYLADIAMCYYIEYLSELNCLERIEGMINVSEMSGITWCDWVIRYQKNVGYECFEDGLVNEL